MADVRNIGFPKNIKKPRNIIVAAKEELIEAEILNDEGKPNSPYRIVASRDGENVGIILIVLMDIIQLFKLLTGL